MARMSGAVMFVVVSAVADTPYPARCQFINENCRERWST